MGGLDFWLLQSINGWPNSLIWFLKFFSVALTLLWVKIVLGIVIVAMLAANAKTRTAILLTLIAVGIGNTMTNIAKSAFPMHRPFQDYPFATVKDDGSINPILHGFHVLMRVGTSPSMGTASAHSANMAAVAFAMCYFFGWRGTPWIAVALLTGISRVYVGAHYPVQVLFGWLVGLFASFVVIKTWEALIRARTGVQSEEDETPELA